jgi:hypothetical protein
MRHEIFKSITGAESRRVRLAPLFLITVLAAAGIVWASIPDSSGVIHACYKKDGNLRVIDTAKDQCKKDETELTWSQTGNQGIPGPPGPPGLQGPPGPPGTGAIATFAIPSSLAFANSTTCAVVSDSSLGPGIDVPAGTYLPVAQVDTFVGGDGTNELLDLNIIDPSGTTLSREEIAFTGGENTLRPFRTFSLSATTSLQMKNEVSAQCPGGQAITQVGTILLLRIGD